MATIKTVITSILFLVILATNLKAKDALIPSLNNDEETIFNYDNLNIEKKNIVEKPPKSTSNNLKVEPNLTKETIEKTVKKEQQPITTKESPLIIAKEPKKIEFFNILDLKTQAKIACPVTPTLKHKEANIPAKFQPNNNLRRYFNSPEISAGDILYIKGQIKDINCTPVAGAVINLWQVDAYGSGAHKDKYFIGNGTAVADNSGNFSFITIFPNEESLYKQHAVTAPNLNIQIKHPDFQNFTTKIYFPLEKNLSDSKFSSLDQFNQNLLTSELVPLDQQNLNLGYFMLFDITVNGVAKFRKL